MRAAEDMRDTGTPDMRFGVENTADMPAADRALRRTAAQCPAEPNMELVHRTAEGAGALSASRGRACRAHKCPQPYLRVAASSCWPAPRFRRVNLRRGKD